ncbi:MAG TPA: PD-(D/E)XK nuclease family protein, partial [Candidatus Thalassarchaeaceae archaeon]
MERIPISHQLSPSSWNRFEECPRKYWLSRQRLPRRASMPASLGNAIHNSMEEICNLDVTDRDDLETEWLSKSMKEILDKHWKIEK